MTAILDFKMATMFDHMTKTLQNGCQDVIIKMSPFLKQSLKAMTKKC